jgi:hypothetical protein
MSSLSPSRAPEKPFTPRRPPRPPQAWSYCQSTRELTIYDYAGQMSVYHVDVARSDCGCTYELVNVDARFGECRTVHVGDDRADDSCDCAGFCYREQCKHLTSCVELIRRGILPFVEKGGVR